MSFLFVLIAPVFVHGFERYRPLMVFINMCVKMIIGLQSSGGPLASRRGGQYMLCWNVEALSAVGWKVKNIK